MTPVERVLVVDDSPQNRMVAAGHLEAAGYEVLSVESGEEALDVLAVQRIDLVILDVLMPGLGGFETCRRIRATPAIAETAILFLTALGDREATGPALEAGGDDLLPKPFHRSELLLRSKALIRAKRTTAELREALRTVAAHNEQLRRVEHDKRLMSQLIVHDLKSPIGVVMANAELIREADLEEARLLGEEILISATQLDRTARDLLDLSRAETGKLTPRTKSFDLVALVGEVVASLRGLAKWSNVAFEIELGVATMIADRELVRRLLANLVHNAVKHSPSGTKIRIEAHHASDQLELRIVDDGPGIPADERERIFEPYVSLDRTRTGSHGLGLAFCRLAAEAHGGAIWVEPRVPRGASFCVRIPQPVA